MPEVTPAAVMMSPSSTKRAPSWTSTPKPLRSSIALWWVIAGRPFRMPASASIIAPVQTEAILRPASWRRRSASGITPRRASR